MELQSFPLSKLYTDPIQRILVPWRFCLYDARRGFVRSSSFGSVILMHGIYRCNEDLSLLNCLAAINLEFVMECKNWLHIQCDTYTRRKLAGIKTLSWKRDQWDFVLNDVGQLGSTRLLLILPFNAEISSCFLFLLLLPCLSSTFRQTSDAFHVWYFQ